MRYRPINTSKEKRCDFEGKQIEYFIGLDWQPTNWDTEPDWVYCFNYREVLPDEPQLAWIPLHGEGSRKPTEADADEQGFVLWQNSIGGAFMSSWNHRVEPMMLNLIHWHPIAKFVPPNPDDEAFEKAVSSVFPPFAGHATISQSELYSGSRKYARAIWDAALAHRDGKQTK